ncbi:Actin-1 [Wickerhamomyces ciferrii]|uniref:Actin-1 n=1 Tax=Wickerhamomyces ciferrii (strain ATCC 14091 / BCRC 22168 / CBS 111 / JCM 3599 / NBRC 0793 / NRRL Y-1031 F-60-10) TaxID=1206466 RepID=K0KSU2_WICCF|nr:Actin-1 [Wickerhamomyces ciferrii]CCH44403.1 Actin-1 [Wickerhamomyces ciferrii]
MAPFHEEHFLIISPGSQITLVQFGLHDGVFAPPVIEIPTKVYSNPDKPGTFLSKGEESNVIYPIVKGSIQNIQAFNFFLKLIYKSILSKHPQVNNIPFLLLSNSEWSRLDIEHITQYVFESMELNAFTIIPNALATLYAHGSQPSAVVIDIGYEKTEITPIVDYSVLNHAKKVINFGGNDINKSISENLNNLSPEQIELLKKSSIFEVLNDEDKKNSFFGHDGLKKNDTEFDVAAIVTSGRTREILEEREKNENEQISNAKLENNSFLDQDGNDISVGKERFKGTENLISQISKNVYQSLNKIIDLTKRQEAWDNILVIGKTTKIKGFTDALNAQLIEDHLVGKDIQENPAQAAFQTTTAPSLVFNQVPNSIKFGKMPEYFPEWKKIGYSDANFLGGQIISKQIFITNNENFFVTRTSYNEKGPLAIWDTTF